MKKRIRTFLLSTALVGGLTIGAIGASGATIHMVVQDHSPFYNSIYAWCQCGEFGTGKYGTDPNRRLKGCWVRMREGSFDKKVTKLGTPYDVEHKITVYTSKISRVIDPLHTCRTSWGWYYTDDSIIGRDGNTITPQDAVNDSVELTY